MPNLPNQRFPQFTSWSYIVVPSEVFERIKKRKKVPEWMCRIAKEKVELAKQLKCDPDDIFFYSTDAVN